VSPLAGLTAVELLLLSGNPATDLSSLEGLGGVVYP